MSSTASKKGPVQTRLSRCADHGLVQATRQMPRLRFPFVVTEYEPPSRLMPVAT